MGIWSPTGGITIPYHLTTVLDNLIYWDNTSLLDLDAAPFAFTFGAYNDGPKTALTGVVTLTNGSAAMGGAGSAFLTELAVGAIVQLDADAPGSYAQVLSVASDTAATLTAPYTGAGGTGAGSKRRMNVTLSWGYNPLAVATEPVLNLNIESNYSSGGGVDPERVEVQWNYGSPGGGFTCRPWQFEVNRITNWVEIRECADQWDYTNAAGSLNFMTWVAPTVAGNGQIQLTGHLNQQSNNRDWLGQMNAAGSTVVELMRLDSHNAVCVNPDGQRYTLVGTAGGAGDAGSAALVFGYTSDISPNPALWKHGYRHTIASHHSGGSPADSGLDVWINDGTEDEAGALPTSHSAKVLSLRGDLKSVFFGGLGVWGHAAPAAQPATPAGTDAQKITDIIAILQGMGACA